MPTSERGRAAGDASRSLVMRRRCGGRPWVWSGARPRPRAGVWSRVCTRMGAGMRQRSRARVRIIRSRRRPGRRARRNGNGLRPDPGVARHDGFHGNVADLPCFGRGRRSSRRTDLVAARIRIAGDAQGRLIAGLHDHVRCGGQREECDKNQAKGKGRGGVKSGDFSRQRKKESPAAFSFKSISSKTMCIRKARRVRALAEPDQSSYHFPPRRNGFCLARFVQKYSDRLHGTPCGWGCKAVSVFFHIGIRSLSCRANPPRPARRHTPKPEWT